MIGISTVSKKYAACIKQYTRDKKEKKRNGNNDRNPTNDNTANNDNNRKKDYKADDERNLVTAHISGFDKISGFEKSMTLLHDMYVNYNDDNGSDF